MPAAFSEQNDVALALGSNLGDRKAMLRQALSGVAALMDVTSQSRVYETPAAYITDQPSFLNMAVTVRTKLHPQALLAAVKALESRLGRQPGERYGPRLIDIDIIFYGDVVLHDDRLAIPHPRMSEREFVLRPLADIAPGWLHPQSQRTVSAMLADLGSQTAVTIGPL